MQKLVAVLALAFLSASAGPQLPTSHCSGANGVPTDSLRTIATRMHPEALKPENQSGMVMIALVFDNHCAVVRHAMRRVAKVGTIGPALQDVFRDSTQQYAEDAFEISGFASLGKVNETPVIVWGILTPGRSSRR